MPTRDADRAVRIRLGILFSERLPWMSGAVIDQGQIQIGDRLFLRTQDGRNIPVRITAIRDDGSQREVTEAAAPQGVFLSFQPEGQGPFVDPGSAVMLLGDPEANAP